MYLKWCIQLLLIIGCPDEITYSSVVKALTFIALGDLCDHSVLEHSQPRLFASSHVPLTVEDWEWINNFIPHFLGMWLERIHGFYYFGHTTCSLDNCHVTCTVYVISSGSVGCFVITLAWCIYLGSFGENSPRYNGVDLWWQHMFRIKTAKFLCINGTIITK